MGLLSKVLKSVSGGADVEAEVQKRGFTVAQCSPDDCASCSDKFPSSMTVDMETPLWGSGKDFSVQLVVATGKTDWLHDPSDEKGSVLQALSKGESDISKAAGGSVKLSASSMMPPDEYLEKGDTRTHVLIMPFFIRVTVDPQTAVQQVVKAIEYAKAHSAGQTPSMKGIENAVKCPNRGYIFLCSHKTRDKRCGITAPIMKKVLENQLRDHDLYRDPYDDRGGGVPIHYVSHVGGHKFSANVIIFLKSGKVLWLGRVRPEHAKAIVDYSILKDGEVIPELLRTAFKSPAIEW
uniref:ARAD1B16346p n=1 Tax=Blastobotrys adeninivorans TaxID=409370 RepID=A0A060TCG4_BLAAD